MHQTCIIYVYKNIRKGINAKHIRISVNARWSSLHLHKLNYVYGSCVVHSFNKIAFNLFYGCVFNKGFSKFTQEVIFIETADFYPDYTMARAMSGIERRFYLS